MARQAQGACGVVHVQTSTASSTATATATARTVGSTCARPTAAPCGDGGRGRYVPRSPSASPLFQIIQTHLLDFLAEGRRNSDDGGLPGFVERELRDFLGCGSFARGFARFCCDDCRADMLVPFSCKGRGFCPSCCGRRMAELSGHLVDSVLGGLPIRQWVLTCPWRLRYAMAWDHRLCRAVLAVFIRAVFGLQRRRARRRGLRCGTGGAVTAIQRAGAALNLNVHFHSLVADGVFVADQTGAARFVPLPPPADGEVARLVDTIRRRVVRLARRRGIELEQAEMAIPPSDALAEDSPLLAGICGASVAGRIATGGRAGRRVQRLRNEPADAAGANGNGSQSRARGTRHAQLAGFDLHADVFVPAGDLRRLEGLTRYVLRPPVAQGALEIVPSGEILLALRRPWRDGTCAIVFSPNELIEKLSALVPRPRINLLLYHGAFAPNARIRRHAVANALAQTQSAPLPGASDCASGQDPVPTVGSSGSEPEPPTAPARTGRGSEPRPPASPATGPALPSPVAGRRTGRHPHPSWAELLRRAWAVDVLACRACGGRLRLLATIQDPAVVHRVLTHLGLPTESPQPLPARAPPQSPELPFPDF